MLKSISRDLRPGRDGTPKSLVRVAPSASCSDYAPSNAMPCRSSTQLDRWKQSHFESMAPNPVEQVQSRFRAVSS